MYFFDIVRRGWYTDIELTFMLYAKEYINMKNKNYSSTETVLYITGWCFIGIFAAVSLVLLLTGIHLTDYLLPCIFHAVTGLYCPGCGGTRSFLFLLHGHPLKSILYHPFVLYAAVLGGWFMITQSIDRASGHRIRIGMKYRDIYLWVALIIVAANFIVKDLLLVVWGIDLLTF